MARNVELKFTANVTSLRAGMLAAAASVKDFEGQIVQVAKTSNETQRIAGKAMLGIGVAVAGGLALAVRSAVQFEQRMRNVSTISGDVQKNFGAAGRAVLEMSGTLGVSANELAEGLYDVASSGFQGAQGMEILRASAVAAQAGLSTTATAARAITGALNAYGLAASDATDVSDIFFQTVNLGIVTFDELAQNAGDFMSTASALGVALDEASAGFATITLAGVPASEAATSLNGVMRALIKPSAELEGVFNALGYESGVAAVKALGLGGVMQKLREFTGGSVESFAALFPEIRATRGALALTAKDGETWSRVAGQITDENGRAGAAAKALAEQQKSLGGQLKIAKEQIVAMAIGLGQTLLPVLRPVVSGLQDLVTGFRGMSIGAQQGVVGIGVLLGGLTTLGGSFLLLGPKIANALKWFRELQKTAPALASSIKYVGLSVGVLGGVLALGGAALAVYAARKGEVKRRVDDLKASLDAETGALSDNTTENIKNRIVSEKLDVDAKRYGISLDTLTQAMLGNKDAQAEVNAAVDAHVDALKAQKNSFGSGAEEYVKAKANADDFKESVSGTASELRKAQADWRRDAEVKAAVAKATGTAAAATDDVTESAQAAAEAEKQLTDQFQRAVDITSVYTSTLSAVQNAERDATQSAKDAMEARHQSERDALENEKITGSASQAAHDRRMKELEVRQEAEKKTAEVTSGANTKVKLSMEDYRKAVEANTKRTQTWMRNLEIVGARGGNALKNQLAALGPEAAGLVEQVATSSDKSFGKFKNTMADSSSAAVDALKGQFDTVPTILGEIGRLGGKALSDQLLEQFRTGAVGVQDIINTLTRLKDEMIQVPGAPPGTYRPRSGGPTASLNAEGHVAQIAPAGSWRVWAEPETGGEAYIPLAYSKRARSAALVADVAGRFGYGLVPMAEGGMWAVPASARAGGTVDPVLLRTLARLEQRLARGGGRIDSVVFQEKIDPLHAAKKIAWALGGR